MIDLRSHVLPDMLEVGGRTYEIETCWRVWLTFSAAVDRREMQSADDLAALYCLIFKHPEEGPDGIEWLTEAGKFAASKNSTPRGRGSADRILDMIDDGEYILSSFMQVYGIDLTAEDCDMHWHRWLALFRGLPEGSKIMDIMHARSWKKPSGHGDDSYRAMKRAWALPKLHGSDERKNIAAQQAMFGKVTYRGGE